MHCLMIACVLPSFDVLIIMTWLLTLFVHCLFTATMVSMKCVLVLWKWLFFFPFPTTTIKHCFSCFCSEKKCFFRIEESKSNIWGANFAGSHFPPHWTFINFFFTFIHFFSSENGLIWIAEAKKRAWLQYFFFLLSQRVNLTEPNLCNDQKIKETTRIDF